MIDLCDDAAPGSSFFLDIIDKIVCEITSLVFTTLGITSNETSTTATTIPSENSVSSESVDSRGTGNHIQYQNYQYFIEFYDELTGWLAFDDFQIELFKLFTLILVSNVALIFVAWHIYGNRISERFMKPGEKNYMNKN